jgi:hypothetical protein
MQLPKIIILDVLKLPSNLSPYLIHGGTHQTTDAGSIKLEIPSNCEKYCDAQLDDYHSLPRKQFLWSPPCRFEIHARASSPNPPGTLGFGFWNDPFTLSLGQGGAARRFPATPQTLWYFYGSPENDLQLAPNLPGFGWKASGIRSPKIPLLLLSPLAGLAVAVSYIPYLRSIMMLLARRFIVVNEVLLEVSLAEWHTYTLDWDVSSAVFRVDGQTVNIVEHPPEGPLGFVIWIDNQFAVASSKKRFQFGVIQTTESHWLEFEIINLSSS